MEKQPRILVFTVAAWNSKVGSNTWPTLLEGYPRDMIANICIRDEYPDSEVCSRYFRISENRVIKSIVKRSVKTGEEIKGKEIEDVDLVQHNARYQSMKKNRRYALLLAREMIWKLGKWKSEELDAFLDDFKPDIILHSMEGYIHLNRIIEYAIKRTGAKSIGYIWDDNFTYKQSNKLGYIIYRYFQRKSLRSLSKKTSKFFAISEMTKREADEFFGIDSILLTKPLSSLPYCADTYDINFPLRILYTGKLIIGRDRTLAKISNILQKLDKSGSKLRLDVYTNTMVSNEYREKVENSVCTIHPPVLQSEAIELQRNADILLFIEDIDGPDSHMARLSFSTKITDYLSSGKCILAIGDIGTAPMDYFIRHDAALIAYNEETITNTIMKLINDRSIVSEYAKKSAESGINNHCKSMILERFHSTIAEVYKEKV